MPDDERPRRRPLSVVVGDGPLVISSLWYDGQGAQLITDIDAHLYAVVSDNPDDKWSVTVNGAGRQVRYVGHDLMRAWSGPKVGRKYVGDVLEGRKTA